MVKLKVGPGLRLWPRPARPETTLAPPNPDPDREISEALRRFRERAGAEEQRFVANTDSEYWIAIGFQSREQKEEFLQKSGWMALGDKYLDGIAVAKLLAVELTTPIPKVPKSRIDQKLLKLAR